MNNRRVFLGSSALGLALLSSGCGGGGGTSQPQVFEEPPPFVADRAFNGNYGVVSQRLTATGDSFSTAGTLFFNGGGFIGSGTAQTISFSSGSGTATAGNATVPGSGFGISASGNEAFFTLITTANGTTTAVNVSGTESFNDAFFSGLVTDANNDVGLALAVAEPETASVASLNGTFNTSFSNAGAGAGTGFGNLTFDGTGNVTAGTLTLNNGTGNLTLTANSTYAVGSGGAVSATLNLILPNNQGVDVARLNGFIGTDGTLVFTISDQTNANIMGVATQGPVNGVGSDILQNGGVLLAAGPLTTNGNLSGGVALSGGIDFPNSNLSGNSSVSESIAGNTSQQSVTVTPSLGLDNTDGIFTSFVLTPSSSIQANLTASNLILSGDGQYAVGVTSGTNSVLMTLVP